MKFKFLGEKNVTFASLRSLICRQTMLIYMLKYIPISLKKMGLQNSSWGCSVCPSGSRTTIMTLHPILAGSSQQKMEIKSNPYHFCTYHPKHNLKCIHTQTLSVYLWFLLLLLFRHLNNVFIILINYPCTYTHKTMSLWCWVVDIELHCCTTSMSILKSTWNVTLQFESLGGQDPPPSFCRPK